jgi:hypothetical protein
MGTLPEPRSSKEGQGSRAHHFRLFGHLAGPHPLVSNVYMSPLAGRFLSVLSVVLSVLSRLSGAGRAEQSRA